MISKCFLGSLVFLLGASLSQAKDTIPVLAGVENLEKAGVKIISQDSDTGVGYARISPAQELALSKIMHDKKRCGGYERLMSPGIGTLSLDQEKKWAHSMLSELSIKKKKNDAYRFKVQSVGAKPLKKPDSTIEEVLEKVDPDRLREHITWLSSYHNRYNKKADPNEHVRDMKERLDALPVPKGWSTSVDLIDHDSTPQKTVRYRIEGSTRPDEVVVLGGHFDSINSGGFFPRPNERAPGADDNASGSSNLLHALEILLEGNRPERSVEIFWYAGEESGLLGSAEIARAYKDQGKDVIGVLQLDMTLFPGSGEFTLASMQDFTSSWLHELLLELNRLYIHGKVVESRCGYGCSDHASWHRQGFPALMPFEATMNKMNRRIHTKDDVIDSRSNFRHSAMFTKIALAFALELGNSELRQPY